MSSSTSPVQILYILGHEHCGSTILEHYLSRWPGIFGAGEVSILVRILREDCDEMLRRCSCGSTILQCPLWQAVDQTLEQVSTKRLTDIDPMSVDTASFRENNQLLFSAITRVTGAQVIIDSSKGIARLSRLIQDTDLSVSVVHLTRPFAGYMNSHKKKYDVGLREILRKFFDYARHSKKNGAVRGTARTAYLRFEDFLTDPEKVSRCLVDARATLHDGHTNCESDACSKEFHSLAGNDVRFHPQSISASRARVDYDKFSPHQRIALFTLDRLAQLIRPPTSF